MESKSESGLKNFLNSRESKLELESGLKILKNLGNRNQNPDYKFEESLESESKPGLKILKNLGNQNKIGIRIKSFSNLGIEIGIRIENFKKFWESKSESRFKV